MRVEAAEKFCPLFFPYRTRKHTHLVIQTFHNETLCRPCGVGTRPYGELERPNRKTTVKSSRFTAVCRANVLTFVSEDNKIGTGTYDDKFMTNTYADLHLLNKYFQAGVRFEYLDHPLPGFEPDFKGWGLPYFYVKGNYKWAELTLGDYYDQFGSGLILRSYEERSLGVDNSLRGGRLVLKPYKGINLKLLGGQRAFTGTTVTSTVAHPGPMVATWN